MAKSKRTTFSSRLGFVLAAAGSAVGLGNIWRFPYLAAKHGGGIFLLFYLALVFTLGFCLMISENAIGRKTGLSVIGAFHALNRRWTFLGILAACVPVIILPYYCVIGGWVIKYFADFVAGSGPQAAADGYFGSFVADPVMPTVWLIIFMSMTALIIILGVKRGIESASKILMPMLIVLTIVVAVYSLTLPGASAGVAYLFVPDFSQFSVETVLAALGQMFYSMSLAMGIMVTYGSYMKKSDNLDKAVKQIEWFDTGMAILAGLMIIPAVFVFSGGDEAALTAGPSLMFITMPKVFASMGGLGHVMGAMFFLLVLFAALTSSMSLMETVVSIVRDRLQYGRTKATVIVYLCSLVLALPSTFGFGIWSDVQLFGMGFLDFFDYLSNSVLMPVVAILTTVFIGFVLTPQVIVDEVTLSGEFRRRHFYAVFIKWIAPVLLSAILVSTILQTAGVLPQF